MTIKAFKDCKLDELVLDTIGNDREKAERWKDEISKYERYTSYYVIIWFVAFSVLIWTFFAVCYLTGSGSDPIEYEDLGEIASGCVLFGCGGFLGSLMALTMKNIKMKVRKRLENIEYMEENQCKS